MNSVKSSFRYLLFRMGTVLYFLSPDYFQACVCMSRVQHLTPE